MRLPPQLTPEALYKAFMELTADRYPAADKVLKLGHQLGIANSIELQIIVFGVMRDMVRQVSREYIYRSLQHRDDIFNAIIAALEELEDKLEVRQDQKMREEIEEAKRADNRPVDKPAR